MKFGVSFASVKAIFLSHLHADHFLGIFGLVQSMNFVGRKEALFIYGPKGTKKFLTSVFSLNELRPAFEIVVEEVLPKKEFFKNDLFTVKAFEVKHNAPHSLGYVVQGHSYKRFDLEKCAEKGVKGKMFSQLQAAGEIEINGKKVKYSDVTYLQEGKKIVYTGDTAQCAAIASNAKNADLLIHDACFLEKDKAHAKEKMHSTCLQAGKNAAKAEAKKLLLTHFSNRYDDVEALLGEAKSVFQNSELASPGKEILI